MARVLSNCSAATADAIIIGISAYIGFSMNPDNSDRAYRMCKEPKIKTAEGYETTTRFDAWRFGPFVKTAFTRVDQRKEENP